MIFCTCTSIIICNLVILCDGVYIVVFAVLLYVSYIYNVYSTDLMQLNTRLLANLESLASECKFARSHSSSRTRASVRARLFFTHARL